MLEDNRKKLYNVIFPIWFLMLFPVAWLVIIPCNFLIDSLVLILSMIILKINDLKEVYKKSIIKIVLFGFLADIIGAGLLLLVCYLFELTDEIYITLPAMVISAILIFAFDYFISFKKFDKKNRLKLSIIYAVVTAPYTFLIPMSWSYY
jgi:hypothetical protein